MERNVVRRLMADHNRLKRAEMPDIHAEPSKMNLMYWNGYIVGPHDSPYEGGKFAISLSFPKNYPKKPPVVKFLSSILHPNIFLNGEVCLEELEESWNQDYDVLSILLLIQQLLREPNFSSPANSRANRLYRKNKNEYYKMIKTCIDMNNEAFNGSEVMSDQYLQK